MALLNEIITNSIYSFLLNEAKTPDEVLAILTKRYKGRIDGYLIEKIMNIDPTKKYSYTQWALKALLNENGEPSDYFSNIKSLFSFAQENNDFQLQTFQSISEAIDGSVAFKGKDEYEIAFENEDWIIYIPNTYEASRYIVHHLYGGARWCTASSSGNYYFHSYTDNGDKLYILANKQTNEIYQYSPQSYEFNNSNNIQVDDPISLVGNDVTEWFEKQGMDIDYTSFPSGDDIYDDGNFGLKHVGGVYAKYVLCDNRGHELSPTIYWSARSVEEFDGAICIVTNEDAKENWYIVDKKDYKALAYFNDNYDSPFFWYRSSVFGLGEDTFTHVSLIDGTVYFEMDDVDEYEKDDSYYVILRDSDRWEYKLYDPWNKKLCTYIDEDGQEREVAWESSPYHLKDEIVFYGENEDGEEFAYNPKTKEYRKVEE